MVTRVLEKYLGDSSQAFLHVAISFSSSAVQKNKRKFLSPLCRNIKSNKFEQCKEKKIQIEAQLSLKKDKICPLFSPTPQLLHTMYYDIEKKY